MSTKRPGVTPTMAVGLGGAAGAAGTVAMDSLWYWRQRRSGSDQSPFEWEFGGVDKWDDVSAPGTLGKRLLEGFLDRGVPNQWAGPTQNVVHWSIGTGWGIAFGIVAGSREHASWWPGLVLGPVAWFASYVVMPLAKVYKPIWEYDAKTLAKDLSAHLVYGAATGAVFTVLSRLAT